MENIEHVCKLLEEHGIAYTLFRHKAVYVMDMDIDLGEEGNNAIICKNLFLCDDKKRNCFLVVLAGDKKADLKLLAGKLGTKSLRFASENRLFEYLKLTRGSVSPLGIINDSSRSVTVVFDNELIGCERLRVHPNDNSATVIVSFDDLKRLIESFGNPIVYTDFE